MSENTIAEVHIEDLHLPTLFQAADRESLEAQRKYLLFVKADLMALVLGALCASFSLPDPVITQITRGLGALLLLVGMCLTLVLMQGGYRKLWFSGRAIAESAKTVAWRYMVGAEPFEKQLGESAAVEKFVDSLREIMGQHEQLIEIQAEVANSERQITPTMDAVRKASPKERKALYLRDRIGGQAQWYSGKSIHNRQAEKKLFLLAIGVQASAFLAATLMVFYPPTVLNPTGILSALAAAVLAWLQVKQHQELAQSYGLAAAELRFIAEKALHIEGEEALSKFVSDAENAISREHTMWLARRDQIVHS